jgi:hypothetical protein
MERVSYFIFFLSILYTLYQGLLFGLIYKNVIGVKFLDSLTEKILLIFSLSYILTAISIGINI